MTRADLQKSIGDANAAIHEITVRLKSLVRENKAKDQELILLEDEAEVFEKRRQELHAAPAVDLREWKGLRELIDQQEGLIQARLNEVNSGVSLHRQLSEQRRGLVSLKDQLKKQLDEWGEVLVFRRQNGRD